MRKPGEHGGRLIIRNLPFGFTLKQLTKLISKIGEVKDLSMPWDEGKKRNKGFAFVEYTKKNLSEKAIKELNGKTFQHRVLSVDYAMSKTHYEKAIKSEELDHAFKPKRPETPSVPGEIPAAEPTPEPAEAAEEAAEAVEEPQAPPAPPKPSNRLFKDRTLFVRNLA
jgi:RNA recognition motif-containing protein